MEWQAIPIRGNTWCTATCAQLSDEVLAGLWAKYCEVLGHQTAPWDYVRVELWDEGRMLVFPANSQSKRRIDSVGCELFVQELASREARADELSDEESEPLYGQITQDATESIVRGITRLGGTWHGEVWIFSADDPEPIRRHVQ